MASKLAGQTAIVTGGGMGFGEQESKALAKEGMNVTVADISAADIERIVQEMTDAGGSAIAVTTDVSDEAQVEAMVKATLDRFGQIDVLINNAGINAPSGDLTACSVEQWDTVFAVNVRGPFLCSKAVLPHMIDRRSGHIVNISSTTARFKYRDVRCIPYTTTKYAVEGFNHCLSTHMEKHGIRVNAFCPTMADTNFQADTPREYFEQNICMTPDHVVEPLLYLLTEMEGTGKSVETLLWYEERGMMDKYRQVFA